jgi:tetratricopeptide (TPR) repeat protein
VSRRPLIVLVMLLSSVALGAFTQDFGKAEPDRPSRVWKRLQSKNFTAVGDATAGEIREALKELEVFRFAISGLLPGVRFSPVGPTLVVFRGDAAFSTFKPRDFRGEPRESVAGYYIRRPEGSHMVVAAGSTSSAERVDRYHYVLHEYAHDVVELNIPNAPRWLDEGLAEFYAGVAGTASDSGGKVAGEDTRVLGRPNAGRVRAIQVGSLFPIEDLIVPERAARVPASRFYAQSWALIHYLLLGRPDRKPGQLRAYVAALHRNGEPVSVFTEVFGTTMEQMNRELQAYVKRGVWNAVNLRVPPELERLPDVEPERLLESEAEALQGHLLYQMGVPDESEERLTRSLVKNGAYAPARVTLAQIRLNQQRHADAMALLQPVVQASPGNLAARLYLGEALRDSGRYEEALAEYTRASQLNPMDANVWAGLSTVQVALGQAERAQLAMQKAQQIAPGVYWHVDRATWLWARGFDADVVRDAEQALEFKTGGDTSVYAAFIGALANRRLKRGDDADALLARAESASPGQWPAVVLTYLRGRLSAADLLKRAKDDVEQTEARAFVGIAARVDGRDDEGLLHLRWVQNRGIARLIAHDLALAELRRLERATEKARP